MEEKIKGSPRQERMGYRVLGIFRKDSQHPLRLATVFTSVVAELFCLSGDESDHFLVSYNTTKLFDLDS